MRLMFQSQPAASAPSGSIVAKQESDPKEGVGNREIAGVNSRGSEWRELTFSLCMRYKIAIL
jgi:hypothetical protein